LLLPVSTSSATTAVLALVMLRHRDDWSLVVEGTEILRPDWGAVRVFVYSH
jgi:hypothetical protein